MDFSPDQLYCAHNMRYAIPGSSSPQSDLSPSFPLSLNRFDFSCVSARGQPGGKPALRGHCEATAGPGQVAAAASGGGGRQDTSAGVCFRGGASCSEELRKLPAVLTRALQENESIASVSGHQRREDRAGQAGLCHGWLCLPTLRPKVREPRGRRAAKVDWLAGCEDRPGCHTSPYLSFYGRLYGGNMCNVKT